MEGKLPPEPKAAPKPAPESEPIKEVVRSEVNPVKPTQHEKNPVSNRPPESTSSPSRPQQRTGGATGERRDNRAPRSNYPPRTTDARGTGAPRSTSNGRPDREQRPSGPGNSSGGYGNRPPQRPNSSGRPGGSGNSTNSRPSGSGNTRPGGPVNSANSRPSGPSNRSGGGARPAARSAVMPPPTTSAKPGKDTRRTGHKERRSPFEENGRRTKDWDQEKFGNKSRKNRGKQSRRSAEQSTMPPVQRRVVLSGPIPVKDFAEMLGIKATDLLKRLINMGIMIAVNQDLDRETAAIVASELSAEVVERASTEEKEEILIQGQEDAPETLQERPPVITVMGHVDHGKTSLLDKIRSTRVTQSEAGGITQHIGASVINWSKRDLVFLDTPGHEAFTAMRARGAQVTDLAVLVVAANDGVMPQTIEALNHAKAAGVPIVVAINKMDLPEANPERVKTELSEHGLIAESWGGDTMMVPVSARTGEGLDNLLESLTLQADILELNANPNRAAAGIVIEAQLDKGRGPVATVLVKKGTLKQGDVFVSGAVFGKVRALINDRGERVENAGPSMPVEVLGFNQLPDAGDDFVILDDERQAKNIADARMGRVRKTQEGAIRGVSLDEFYQRLKDEALKDLNLVVKADVHGSLEALSQSIGKLESEEVRVRILHSGVGSVTESDVMLAQASGAIIIGFGVSVESKARALAEREHVDIRHYRVIYDVLDNLKNAMTGLLDPKYQEVVLGRAEVREVFRVPKIGAIGGCYVIEGKILRSGKARVIRDGVVIHEGSIGSLKRFKDDVREVATGYECGIGLERFNDIKVGDVFEVFTEQEIKAS